MSDVKIEFIRFSDWYYHFLKQSDDIIKVSKQVDLLKRKIVNGESCDQIFYIVHANVVRLLSHLTSIICVDVKKPDDFQNAFWQFSSSLYGLLLVMRGIDSDID